MKKIIMGLIIFLCFSTSVTAISAQNSYFDVFEPDYTVTIDGKVLNDATEYPLFEYQGSTYISLRDYAKFLGGTVSWEEDRQYAHLRTRYLYNHIAGEVLFDDTNAARLIGRALAEEKYSKKITDKTEYSIIEFELSGSFSYYSIYVYFDGIQVPREKELSDWGHANQYADAEIRYFVRSGEIYFLERRGQEWIRLYTDGNNNEKLLYCNACLEGTPIVADKLFLGTATEFNGVVVWNDTMALNVEGATTPALLYNGRVYMPLRTMANEFLYDITWNEGNRVAAACKKRYTLPMVETPRTALEIGKATTQWHFKDKISEKTTYCVHLEKEVGGGTTTFFVYVFFNGEKVNMNRAEIESSYAKRNADTIIYIDGDCGFVRSSTCNGDTGDVHFLSTLEPFRIKHPIKQKNRGDCLGFSIS